MEYLLAPDLLGKVIQTVGAIIVAIITKYGVNKVASKNKKDEKQALAVKRQQRKFQINFGWIITGVVAALTFGVLGLAYDALSPEPTVNIISPKNGDSIVVKIADTGSGSFFVEGNSTGVIDKMDLRVYVFVHPADPFAEGWWKQPAVVMESDGSWSTQSWIGDKGFPPHVGDLIDIVALVAASEHIQDITKGIDPKDIKPKAQSNIVRFNIGTIK